MFNNVLQGMSGLSYFLLLGSVATGCSIWRIAPGMQQHGSASLHEQAQQQKRHYGKDLCHAKLRMESEGWACDFYLENEFIPFATQPNLIFRLMKKIDLMFE